MGLPLKWVAYIKRPGTFISVSESVIAAGWVEAPDRTVAMSMAIKRYGPQVFTVRSEVSMREDVYEEESRWPTPLCTP